MSVSEKIKSEIEKMKEEVKQIDKQNFLKYCKLIGIIFASLMVGLSVFYLITDYFDWFIYVPFLIFGIVFIYLFTKIGRRGVGLSNFSIKKEDKKLKKLLKKIEQKEKEKDREYEF